eukprot:c22004_g1_i1 orf=414-1307(-)
MALSSSSTAALLTTSSFGQPVISKSNPSSRSLCHTQQFASFRRCSRCLRASRSVWTHYKIVCSVADATSGQASNADENPYQVLGVNPLDRFDVIKVVYKRKHKDAERRGDDAAMSQIERAYDKIMMVQLQNRKQGLTFGSVEVSKDIKYADRQPFFPWGPRFAQSSKNDIIINLAMSACFVVWVVSARSTNWKPLQFLIFGYMWRIFNKLKNFEPSTSSFSSDEEDQIRRTRSGKCLLRTLGLVFTCIGISSLVFTCILNAYELLGYYIPRVFLNSQELFITVLSSVLLFFIGSYYR